MLPTVSYGMGLSPASITIDSVLLNSTQQQTVSVQREGDLSKDQVYTAIPRGEYGHYIMGPQEFTILAGQTESEYTFEVTPKNASIGTYTINIDFVPKQSVDEDTLPPEGYVNVGIGVVSGVSLPVTFTVTGDEHIEYTLDNLNIKEAEVDTPLSANIDVHNTGNVEWKADSMKFFFTDTTDSTHIITSMVNSEDIALAAPGSITTLDIPIDVDIPQGKYIARVDVFDDDKLVAQLAATNTFTVYPAGTFQLDGTLTELSTNKSVYTPYEKIKLSAAFQNTGEISTTGIVITEIYKENNLLDVLRSNELTIDKNETVTFSQIVELHETGSYTLSSYVEYGTKVTDTKTLSITIAAADSVTSSLSNSRNGLIGLGIMICIIFGITIIYKRKKLKK